MEALRLRSKANHEERTKNGKRRPGRSSVVRHPMDAPQEGVSKVMPRFTGGPGCVDLDCAGDAEAISGELALWGAVLLQAIEDYRRKGAGYEVAVNGIKLRGWYYDREIGCDKRRAEAWFRSKSEDLGSYRWICDLLQLDPERVWARIREKDFALSL